jgi:hypothetical protein
MPGATLASRFLGSAAPGAVAYLTQGARKSSTPRPGRNFNHKSRAGSCIRASSVLRDASERGWQRGNPGCDGP